MRCSKLPISFHALGMMADLIEKQRDALALTFVSLLLALLFIVAGGRAAWSKQSSPSTKTTPHKQLVAVLAIQPVGATKAQASALTDRLGEELLRTGKFILVDRSQINAILNEQALQQTGCTEQECAVQVGRILGVRKIVAGKVNRIDQRTWLLSAILVDVETAQTDRSVSVAYQGGYFNLLTHGAAKLATELTEPEVESTASAAPPKPLSAPPPPEQVSQGSANGGAYVFATVFALGSAVEALRASTFNSDAKSTALTNPVASQKYETDRNRAEVIAAVTGVVALTLFITAMDDPPSTAQADAPTWHWSPSVALVDQAPVPLVSAQIRW